MPNLGNISFKSADRRFTTPSPCLLSSFLSCSIRPTFQCISLDVETTALAILFLESSITAMAWRSISLYSDSFEDDIIVSIYKSNKKNGTHKALIRPAPTTNFKDAGAIFAFFHIEIWKIEKMDLNLTRKDFFVAICYHCLTVFSKYICFYRL